MLIICSHSSINHENLAKINLADVEMIGLKGFVKRNKQETAAEHIACRAS